ncbi:Ppx/GppA phosphatase family protein [Raoultibacter phocaeensis]|uniref:Ppx/GppA phosphatase family protein n=1 Tax=Raoultibacter phocaeensis TaxID=2479841 RepID=UPI00111BC858|nr:Ppx/GppA phosphatase family protein [Raoultibacter phocaeensis]
MQSKRYAAIDIGTVTCRLLVADADETDLNELRREVVITNLGEGVDATGVLKPEAMERVAAQMKRFLAIIEEYKTPEHPEVVVIAMATSASRDAKNSSEFAAMLDGIGIRLTVIPGEREAALSFLGASSDFLGEDLLVVDIGGGSTEVIAGTGGCEPVFKHSFDIGCRRVTERFLAADPPTAGELYAAKTWTKHSMAPKFDELAATGFKPSRMIAVAGTATSIVSIDERMEVYDSERVHKTVVPLSVLEKVYAHLRSVPLAERKEIVGLDPGRASVIVAGMVIVETVMELARMKEFTVSETDILQGIILDAARNG